MLLQHRSTCCVPLQHRSNFQLHDGLQPTASAEVHCSAQAHCLAPAWSAALCTAQTPPLQLCAAATGVTRSSYTAVPLPAAELCTVRVMRPGRPADSMEVVTEQLEPALEWGCVLVEWRCGFEEGSCALIWVGL